MAETTGLEIQKLPANPTEGDVQVNAAFDLIDAATQQHLAINFASDADLTLSTTGTIAQWQYAVIELTDTGPILTAARNIIVPNNERVYKVLNSTAQQLTLKTSAGTGVDVPASESTIAFCDGTNVRAISSGGGGSGTTYSISAETVSGGANLRLTGSDSSTDDVKLAAGNNVTVTRTDANTITIASSGAGAATSSQLETYTYTATAGQTAFSGSDDNGNSLLFESFNNILVLLNGVKLVYTDDFTVGTNSITLVSGANVNDVLEVVVVEVAPQGKNLIINGNKIVNQQGSTSLTELTDDYNYDTFYYDGTYVYVFVEDVNVREGVFTLSWESNNTAEWQLIANTSTSADLSAITTGWTAIANEGQMTLASITGNHLWIRFTAGVDGLNALNNVQLEKGSVKTDFEYRPVSEELSLCQRYYLETEATIQGYADASGRSLSSHVYWKVQMRTTPTVSNSGGSVSNASAATVDFPNDSGARFVVTAAGAGGSGVRNRQVIADARI